MTYGNHDPNAIMGYRPQQYMPMQMPMQQAPPPLQPDAHETGLLQIVWRRKFMIMTIMAVCIAVGFVYAAKAKKYFTATASLSIEPPVTSLSVAAPSVTDTYLAAQTTIIESTAIISDAIKNGQLADLGSLKGKNTMLEMKGYLSADVGKKDQIITVAYTAPDPEDAAKIANAVVDSYVLFVTNKSEHTMNAVVNILKKEHDIRDADLKTKQKAFWDFRGKNPGIGLDPAAGSVVLEKLQRYSAALGDAKITTIRARAQYDANPAAVNRHIWEQAKAIEGELQAVYDEAQQEAYQQSALILQYAKLKSDVDQAEVLMTNLEQRIKEAEIQATANHNIPTITVLEPATSEFLPITPQRSRVLAVAGVVGLMLGVGFGLLRDWMDQRLRSAEEVMATLGVPVLGTVPHMSRRLTPQQRGQKVFLEPMSDVAEAFRTIRTAVYFGVRSDRAKTLLVTSSMPGDGKSTTASNLAIAMAQAGQRTLIIDCDFRKPTQHKLFDLSDEIGVSTVLAGRQGLDQAIQRTTVEGLDMLPGGPIPLNPSEILNSQAFADMVDELSLKYDHLVIDSPPVNAVTDARILGALCDVTVLVLRAEKSTRKHSEYARDGLMSVGARILGCVVNDVAKGTGSAGFYSGYGYYGNAQNAVAITGGLAMRTTVAARRTPRPSADADIVE